MGGRSGKGKGSPTEVNVYGFPNKELGKVSPYGVYDMARNEGWVSVGITHDTADSPGKAFAAGGFGMGKYVPQRQGARRAMEGHIQVGSGKWCPESSHELGLASHI